MTYGEKWVHEWPLLLPVQNHIKRNRSSFILPYQIMEVYIVKQFMTGCVSSWIYTCDTSNASFNDVAQHLSTETKYS